MATMSQAIKEAFGESGGVLSREAIKQSVESRYPGKWQPTTLSAHLYACAINNPKAYVHHPHAERFLYKLADGTTAAAVSRDARRAGRGPPAARRRRFVGAMANRKLAPPLVLLSDRLMVGHQPSVEYSSMWHVEMPGVKPWNYLTF